MPLREYTVDRLSPAREAGDNPSKKVEGVKIKKSSAPFVVLLLGTSSVGWVSGMSVILPKELHSKSLTGKGKVREKMIA